MEACILLKEIWILSCVLPKARVRSEKECRFLEVKDSVDLNEQMRVVRWNVS